ncbi:MAG: T9SS type A sorting domain-containing protein [Bacteroidales bacterium]
MKWKSYPQCEFYNFITNKALIGSIQSNLTSYTDNPGAGIFYYMIEVVNPNNCNPSKSMNSSLSNIIQTSNVGINEQSGNRLKFEVYPNPFKNELIIESKGNTKKLSFEILNAIGQIVFKGKLIEKTIVQTTDFIPGVYVIRLENGKTFEFKKIVKE